VTAIGDRIEKMFWGRDLAMRGQERKESLTPALAEALRNEIRVALEVGGKPYKNPFGDATDGRADAALTAAIGSAAQFARRLLQS
jgi:hypothetical protein